MSALLMLHITRNLGFRRLGWPAGLVGACLAVATCDAATLSGMVGMDTTAAGAWTGESRWNTVGGDSIVSMFVVGSGNLLDPFLNGPSDSQAAISIPLGLGTSTLTLFAPGGVDSPFHGLNLFFNGNGTAPGISVFAPTQNSATPPSFQVNSSPNSQALAGQTVPAAGSLIFTDGTSLITLTDFRWTTMDVHSLDRVGFVPFGPSSVGPDGRLDRVAQFTLSIVAVPEPGTLVLFGLGIGMFVMRPWRLRSTSGRS